MPDTKTPQQPGGTPPAGQEQSSSGAKPDKTVKAPHFTIHQRSANDFDGRPRTAPEGDGDDT